MTYTTSIWQIVIYLLSRRKATPLQKKKWIYGSEGWSGKMLSVVLLTVFVAQCHNPVHVVSVVHNITREVFDIHTNIWSFFHLCWKNTKSSGKTAFSIKRLIQANLFRHLLLFLKKIKNTVLLHFKTNPQREFCF